MLGTLQEGLSSLLEKEEALDVISNLSSDLTDEKIDATVGRKVIF